MIVKSLVKKGEYHDSVTLMRVAKELAEQAEVADSAVVMGTPENLKLLESSGLRTPEMAGAGETDLLIVVKAPTEARAQALLESASGGLRKKTKAGAKGDGYRPKSLESALEALPEARLALISIAGRYAGDEAMKALERGLHVMLFSDNIPLEKEIELKTFAAARGLFVMGPDAGTAIINGVPLAFANQVARGPVGIVAASGTGLQEVTTLISNAGSGVSQAIGTGGRDVKKEVGGIMFLQGMRALLDDPQTQVLLLISKPPHESVLEKIRALARTASKPIVATFLGAEPASSDPWMGTRTLEEGAMKAVALARGTSREETLARVAQELKAGHEAIARRAGEEIRKLKPRQRYLRGMYTGGTYVSEAQVLLQGRLSPVFSNAPFGASRKPENALKSEAHTLIDFGEDEFTVGRPHPMIDFSLRNKRIFDEARDPEVAVLLFDLVLGWGAHPDPVPELVPVIEKAQRVAKAVGRHLPMVACVTGTDTDPQNRTTVVRALEQAGVIVEASHAAAAELAIRIAQGVN